MSSIDTIGTQVPTTPLFGGLNQEDWPGLLARVTRLDLQEGESLFLQGELADAFFVLVSGSAEIRMSGDCRGQQIMALLGPGSVIGEGCLFLTGTHSASVYATEQASVLRFQKDDFLEMVWSLDAGAVRVLYNMAHALADRLRSADLAIAQLADRSRMEEIHVLGAQRRGKIPFGICGKP